MALTGNSVYSFSVYLKKRNYDILITVMIIMPNRNPVVAPILIAIVKLVNAIAVPIVMVVQCNKGNSDDHGSCRSRDKLKTVSVIGTRSVTRICRFLVVEVLVLV